MKSFLLAVTCALVIPVTLIGCGDDDNKDADPHDNRPADCSAIFEACHPKDTGEGKPHECHELGEEGTAAECAEEKASCLAACSDSDAG